MKTSTTAFDALPLELLWAIFDLSDHKSILNVGKTCHRLNSIAVPIFLQRINITQPAESVFIRPLHNDYADQLSGLTVDFSFVSIKHFVCVLNNRQNISRDWQEDFRSLSPIEGLTKNIKRVNQLLYRLKSVGSVCIVFYSMGGFWSLRSAVVEDFVTAFFELLNTIVSTACASLQILHPHPITSKPPYKFQLRKDTDLENIVIKGLSMMKLRDNELEGDGWRYRQLFKYNGSPSPPPQLTTMINLTTLELNSDFLLVPPFASWTFAVMKQSQVTSLSLSLPSVISKDEFHYYIFPHIIDALPDLQEIRLAAYRDEFLISAIDFLPKLQHLKKITFGASQYGQFPPPSYELSTSQLRLSSLSVFTGYIEQASYLLGNITCPMLSSINLIIDDTRGRANYIAIGKKLSALRDRLAQMGIVPIINVCLSNHGHGKQTPLPAYSAFEDRDWTGSFSAVSRLTLELPILPNDDTSFIRQMEYVMGWLDVFTGLIGLTLTTRQPYQESDLLTNMITSEYTNIKTFNIVDYPGVFHFHWSSAPNDLRRGIDRRSDLSTFRNKSIEGCVCSEF